MTVDERTVRAVFADADALNPAAYAARFVPEGRVRFGNNPEKSGRAEIEAAVGAFFEILAGMSHSLTGLWPFDGGWAVEAEVSYSVKGVAEPVVVSGVTVLRTRGDEIVDARIYYDLAPVFEAARSAGESPRAEGGETIEHERSNASSHSSSNKASFVLRVDGEEKGRLDYSLAGDLAIFEHTFVDASLRGTGAATRLVAFAIQWAHDHEQRIMPLCPFVRGVLARRPDLAKLVVR